MRQRATYAERTALRDYLAKELQSIKAHPRPQGAYGWIVEPNGEVSEATAADSREGITGRSLLPTRERPAGAVWFREYAAACEWLAARGAT